MVFFVIQVSKGTQKFKQKNYLQVSKIASKDLELEPSLAWEVSLARKPEVPLAPSNGQLLRRRHEFWKAQMWWSGSFVHQAGLCDLSHGKINTCLVDDS